jgi:hypothetical protein
MNIASDEPCEDIARQAARPVAIAAPATITQAILPCAVPASVDKAAPAAARVPTMNRNMYESSIESTTAVAEMWRTSTLGMNIPSNQE